jgi:hypothetical protein
MYKLYKTDRIITAMYRKNTGKIESRLSIIDHELFNLGKFFVTQRIKIIGASRKNTSVVYAVSFEAVTMRETDWYRLNKTKPLIHKVIKGYQDVGINLFEETDKVITLF